MYFFSDDDFEKFKNIANELYAMYNRVEGRAARYNNYIAVDLASMNYLFEGGDLSSLNLTVVSKQLDISLTPTNTVNQQQKEINCMIGTDKLKKIKNISYRVRNGRVEIRFYRNGKQISVYGINQSEAIDKYKNWKPKKVNKKIENSSKHLTFGEWYYKWKDLYKSKKVSIGTLKTMESSFKRFVFPFIENKRINIITTEDIQEILNNMGHIIRERTITFNNLNQCFKKALRPQKLKYNPCEDVEFERVNVINEGRALTIAEQKKLEEYCSTNPSREKLAFLIYLATGMRPGELLHINGIDDVDRENNTIHIRGTKTKKSDAIIVFPKQTVDLIPKEKKPFDYQRNVLQMQFRIICAELKLTGITLKSLRTTFATRCRENGIPEEIIMYYMRHTKVDTTQSYIKTQQDHINNFLNSMPFNFTLDLPLDNDEKQ